MALEKLLATAEDGLDQNFRKWTDDSVAARWELGRERYHKKSINFQGPPTDHAIEEALDLLVYLWVMRRRRKSGDVDAEWRPMTPESQRGCQAWIESKLLVGYDSGDPEDRAVLQALRLLRVLWEEKEAETTAAATVPAERHAMEVAV